ncbi:hypothetical protein KIN20_028534 [Parelaphostrongylus tenuis]|uniref:Uncharacterized protein n=1 Tax=Parelaphostrongylus tenuis TaxID=148309 RepID=A0AAD5R1E3_PARTN|nr:hypothetical protein KIN20_028534 [Parelaphostrongylus tenuis]
MERVAPMWTAEVAETENCYFLHGSEKDMRSSRYSQEQITDEKNGGVDSKMQASSRKATQTMGGCVYDQH